MLSNKSSAISINSKANNILLKSYLYSLLNLFKNYRFWLFFCVTIFIFLFFGLILPGILHLTHGLLFIDFYCNPTWITIVYPVSCLVIVSFSALTGELNSNKNENIYILTKNIGRIKYLFSKILSTITISMFFTIFVFFFFIFISIYVHVRTKGTMTFFNVDVQWYRLLITFLIMALFGSMSCIVAYQMRATINVSLLILLVGFFIFLFPMIWYVDDSAPKINMHRIWYLFYGPVAIYLPLFIIGTTSFTWLFSKQRFNI